MPEVSLQMSGLHVAARDGNVAFLFSICTLACDDINPRDVWGQTPLDHAIMAQEWGCAVLLLSQGGMVSCGAFARFPCQIRYIFWLCYGHITYRDHSFH